MELPFSSQSAALLRFEIALFEILKESLDERARDDAAAPQDDQPFDREPDRDHRSAQECQEQRQAQGLGNLDGSCGDLAMLGLGRSGFRRRGIGCRRFVRLNLNGGLFAAPIHRRLGSLRECEADKADEYRRRQDCGDRRFYGATFETRLQSACRPQPARFFVSSSNRFFALSA